MMESCLGTREPQQRMVNDGEQLSIVVLQKPWSSSWLSNLRSEWAQVLSCAMGCFEACRIWVGAFVDVETTQQNQEVVGNF